MFTPELFTQLLKMSENSKVTRTVLFNEYRKELTSAAKTFSAIKGNLYMIWKLFHLPLTPYFLHLIFMSPSKLLWNHTVSGFERITNFRGEGSPTNVLRHVIVTSLLLVLTSDGSWVCFPQLWSTAASKPQTSKAAPPKTQVKVCQDLWGFNEQRFILIRGCHCYLWAISAFCWNTSHTAL